MKRIFLFLAFAAAAFAADISGKWTGDITGPDGANLTIGYQFKQEGAKLTGTVTGPGGDLAIQNGTVEGDKVTFSLTFNEMKVGNEGTIKGEEIILTVKVNGENFGGPVTLKRVK
jgi:hypothetical protein